MRKARNSAAWTEVGYDLFAEEGLDGLQVERLARILQLNKSGFYHYFGDLEFFIEELLKVHVRRVTRYFDKLRKVTTVDPEFVDLLMEFRMPVLFQMQLDRRRDKPSFNKLSDWVDQNENLVVEKLWCDYLGVEGNSTWAMRYFDIFRGLFFERIGPKNYSVKVLNDLFKEAKEVLNQLSDQKALEKDGSFH